VLHDDTEHQRRFALRADREAGRILVAALDLGHVAELERALAGGDRNRLDALHAVDGAIEAQLHARTGGSMKPAEVTLFCLPSASITACALMPRVARRWCEISTKIFCCCSPRIFTFCTPGDAQQALAHLFRLQHHLAMRQSLADQGKQREIDVGILVVDDRSDDPARQVQGLVAELLAHLVELLLHFLGRVSSFR
jgi:hypothetical protein